MDRETDAAYHRRRAQQHLDLAEVAATRPLKELHLNMAAEHATKAELASRTDLPPRPPLHPLENRLPSQMNDPLP